MPIDGKYVKACLKSYREVQKAHNHARCQLVNYIDYLADLEQSIILPSYHKNDDGMRGSRGITDDIFYKYQQIQKSGLEKKRDSAFVQLSGIEESEEILSGILLIYNNMNLIFPRHYLIFHTHYITRGKNIAEITSDFNINHHKIKTMEDDLCECIARLYCAGKILDEKDQRTVRAACGEDMYTRMVNNEEKNRH